MRDPIDQLIERQCNLIAVMHRLSPVGWKIVSLIAHDDFVRQAEKLSPVRMLNSDIYEETGIDMSQPTASEERSGLTLVGDQKLTGLG